MIPILHPNERHDRGHAVCDESQELSELQRVLDEHEPTLVLTQVEVDTSSSGTKVLAEEKTNARAATRLQRTYENSGWRCVLRHLSRDQGRDSRAQEVSRQHRI